MRRPETLSIRLILTVLVFAIGCLLMISSATQVLEALREKKQAAQVKVIANTSRTLFQTFVSTRNERGTFIAATLSEQPATPVERRRIAVNRQISERTYQEIVAQRIDGDIPGLAQARDRLLATHAAMQAVRERIDAGILKPKAERDASLVGDAPRIANDYIGALNAVDDLLEATIATTNPVVARLLAVKQAAWGVRNYGGFITLRIERAVALGQPWTPEDVAAANQDAGRVDYAWKQLLEAVHHAPMPQSLIDLIARGERYFSGPMAKERARYIHILATGGTIAIPATDLQRGFILELTPMVDIANGALDAMVAEAEEQLVNANKALLFNSLEGAAAVLLTISGFVFVYFRISRPLARMTQSMKQLANRRQEMVVRGDGDATAPLLQFAIPYIERHDEIGAIAHSLELLRKSLLEQQLLAQRERESIEHLRRAEKDLIDSERLAALGRLVAGIAHEINTPLGSALMVATTLEAQEAEFREKFEGGQGRMQKRDLEQFLSTIRTAAEIQVHALSTAANLIGDFKQVAVDQAGEQQRPFLLGELVEQVISTLRPSFKHVPHRIESTITEDIAMDSFPGPLGQVITNLIANGMIHGLADRATGTVTVSAVRNGDRVKIAIADDGIGIASSHQSHIFEPFYTTKLGQGGSGLGLHIARSIVISVLGGSIDMVTAESVGTTFFVDLPCILDRKASAVQGPAASVAI